VWLKKESIYLASAKLCVQTPVPPKKKKKKPLFLRARDLDQW
jgi:hypothetical protein